MKAPPPFPGEVWTIIIQNLSNPSPLSHTCKYLYNLTRSPYTIACWIAYRYTLDYAFMGVLDWWIPSAISRSSFFRASSKPAHSCCPSLNCKLESLQIQVTGYLLKMGMDVEGLEDFVLKEAIAMGHWRYADWILGVCCSEEETLYSSRGHTKRKSRITESLEDREVRIEVDTALMDDQENIGQERGSDQLTLEQEGESEENSSEDPRASHLYQAIRHHQEPLVRILLGHKVSAPKALNLAIYTDSSLHMLELLLKSGHSPSGTLVGYCISRASVAHRLSFLNQKGYLWRLDRIQMLLEALPDSEFEEFKEGLVLAASELGSIPVMTSLLDKKKGDVSVNFDNGNPVFTSLLVGNYSLLKFLLPRLSPRTALFTPSRIALIVMCTFEHVASLYGLLWSCTALLNSILCRTRGYYVSARSGLDLSLMTTSGGREAVECVGAGDSEALRILGQQIGSLCFTVLLVLILQVMMPFPGVLFGCLLVARQRWSRPSQVVPASLSSS